MWSVVQAAAPVRRMARLLYAVHLLLEDGILAAAVGRLAPSSAGADLGKLAGQLHATLQDMADAFSHTKFVPSRNLQGFLKVAPRLTSSRNALAFQLVLLQNLVTSGVGFRQPFPRPLPAHPGITSACSRP